ncbi:hypothetical protein NDU88_005386 [Pleurodeles waltl]|uniref:Uncharacterized protein n=1 Tax=Pleurodeles waltl TaxID=8319 RepID=A0AAV7QKJ4_PLEWA|nr:hypothetical protein NDU88_005386 [Pleurodeles waltl]
MVRNKGCPLLQVNKMDKYAVPRPAGGTVVPDDAEGGQEKDQGPADEPSRSTKLAAIQELCGSLEPKLDAVTVDVNLLHADLKKVTEKVTNAETVIARYGLPSDAAGDGAAREGTPELVSGAATREVANLGACCEADRGAEGDLRHQLQLKRYKLCALAEQHVRAYA